MAFNNVNVEPNTAAQNREAGSAEGVKHFRNIDNYILRIENIEEKYNWRCCILFCWILFVDNFTSKN